MGVYNNLMKQKLRDRKLQVWLDNDEFNFLESYSRENHLTISELIRYWIHQSMKKDGKIKDVSIDTKIKTRRSK